MGGLARWGAGLFAIERSPLNLRLAVRGTLGLIAPLLIGQALAWPSLNVAALAAFLLAFGDLTEDRGWLRRLAAGTACGALAVASGVLAGSHPVTAVLAMLAWGVLLGVAGVYGDAAAAMALPVAWAFLEIGLSAGDHGLADAARLGGLFLVGGAWAIALAAATRIVRRDRPLVERTARCFTLLADYLEHALAAGRGPVMRAPSTAAGYAPSAETGMRSAIADARRLSIEARSRQTAASRSVQRLVLLIELAERAFFIGALLGETRARRPTSDPAPIPTPSQADAVSIGVAESSELRALLPSAAREVARAVEGRIHPAGAAGIAASLERLGASLSPGGAAISRAPGASVEEGLAARDDDAVPAHGLLVDALLHALHIATGDEMPALAASGSILDPVRRPGRIQRLLAPLRACADRRSVVARHALRYGVVTAAAVAVDKALGAAFGYWIPLTVTVVLKPYAGSTLTRAGQRLGGTIAGVAVGVLAVHLLRGPLTRSVASSAAFFAAIAVLPLNYSLAVFFLSAGVVPFDTFLGAGAEWRVGMLRVVDTCVGGALALAGGYLLWPSFERRSLPVMLEAALASTAAYADGVLASLAGDPPPPAALRASHERAGLDNTNLQASFQRVVAEPGADPERLQAALVAVVTLQRLLQSLNALRETAPAIEPKPELAQFRELVRRGLAHLVSALRAGPPPLELPELASGAREISQRIARRAGLHDRLLALEIDRAAWQVATLRSAVRRIGPAGLERVRAPASTRAPS